MFEAFIEDNDEGKYALSVRGHIAGEFENELGAFGELKDLVNHEIKNLEGGAEDAASTENQRDTAINACEARIERGADISEAFNILREELTRIDREVSS